MQIWDCMKGLKLKCYVAKWLTTNKWSFNLKPLSDALPILCAQVLACSSPVGVSPNNWQWRVQSVPLCSTYEHLNEGKAKNKLDSPKRNQVYSQEHLMNKKHLPCSFHRLCNHITVHITNPGRLECTTCHRVSSLNPLGHIVCNLTIHCTSLLLGISSTLPPLSGIFSIPRNQSNEMSYLMTLKCIAIG